MLNRKRLTPPLKFKIESLWHESMSDETRAKMNSKQQRIKEHRDEQLEIRRPTSS